MCDDDWNIEGAGVVCRMLGYDGALEYVHSGKFGPGQGERENFAIQRMLGGGKGVARGESGGHAPPNPPWTKTRILVIMINTCHCVIVFLLGF